MGLNACLPSILPAGQVSAHQHLNVGQVAGDRVCTEGWRQQCAQVRVTLRVLHDQQAVVTKKGGCTPMMTDDGWVAPQQQRQADEQYQM